MVDTFALAQEEKKLLGSGEQEFSYVGEADLHRHLSTCDKNPGHQNFVPVDQFNVDHLPPGCHDNDLVDLVRAMSDLTVRVDVRFISDKRCGSATGRNKFNSFHECMCSKMLRTGSGWIWAVDIYPDENNKSRTCFCKKCLSSSTPRTRFACIRINTAAHLVFNKQEGKYTTCYLFFDKGGTPDNCDNVITLCGAAKVWSNLSEDWCRMAFVTHDMNLAERLSKMVNHWYRLTKRVKEKYLSSQLHRQLLVHSAVHAPNTWPRLTFIVSHPHGCSKHVSVGFSIRKVELKGGVSQYTYTTATCCGCSGAHVIIMGRNPWVWFDTLIHSGNHDDTERLNYSSFASDGVLDLT